MKDNFDWIPAALMLLLLGLVLYQSFLMIRLFLGGMPWMVFGPL